MEIEGRSLSVIIHRALRHQMNINKILLIHYQNQNEYQAIFPGTHQYRGIGPTEDRAINNVCANNARKETIRIKERDVDLG